MNLIMRVTGDSGIMVDYTGGTYLEFDIPNTFTIDGNILSVIGDGYKNTFRDTAHNIEAYGASVVADFDSFELYVQYVPAIGTAESTSAKFRFGLYLNTVTKIDNHRQTIHEYLDTLADAGGNIWLQFQGAVPVISVTNSNHRRIG